MARISKKYCAACTGVIYDLTFLGLRGEHRHLVRHDYKLNQLASISSPSDCTDTVRSLRCIFRSQWNHFLFTSWAILLSFGFPGL
eukprot:g10527.t1